MNKGIELVRTINWKEEVEEWQVFETPDWIGKWLMRNYKWRFQIVEENKGTTVEEKEKKGSKKWWWKVNKK